jgi:iron(III) transport system permease protein
MKPAFWVIFGLLIVFILVPVVMLFKESVVGEVPISEEQLMKEMERILASTPEEQQAQWAQEWFARFDEGGKVELYRLALKRAGLEGKVEIRGLAEIETQVAGLEAVDREKLEKALRLEVFKEKRALLMFKVKPYVSDKEFERLRSGKVKVLTLEHYRKVLKTPYLLGSITRSLRIALISMIFTVGVSYLFAYVINRTTSRYKGFFNSMMLLPLVSPPVIMAFALIMLFGRRGIITNGLLDRTLHLINAEHLNIYGMHGIVLAQLLTYGPMAFVVLHSVLAQLDTRIEEAAENLGATRWDIFWKVTLPMSAPGLFQAALLTFALCLQDFGNPRVIGGDVTMIAGVMYDQMIAFQNTNIASVLGTILLIPSVVAFTIGNLLLARKTYVSKEPGGLQYIPETPKRYQLIFNIVCFVYSVFVLSLYMTIVWGSFTKVWGQDGTLTLAYYTTKGITEASQLEADVGSLLGLPLIWESVKTMGLAGLIGGILAVVAGYLLERRKDFISSISGYIIMLTVALPGVVFGIGYILTFNAPLGIPQLTLTGTLALIILLVVFTRMYGGVTPTQAVLQKVDETVEEAATSLGASRFYTFRRVVFPALRRPWLLGSLYIFVSGLVALGGVIFLTTAQHPLASVQIYILAEQGKYGLACSHSTYLILVVLMVQMFIRYIEGREKYTIIASA